MIRLLLVYIICFYINSGSAQISATLDPNPSSAKVDITEFNTIAYATLTNSSETDTLVVMWEIITNSITEGWEVSVCDLNKCYGPETPVSPDNRPIELAPGQSSNLDVYIYPYEKVGAAEIDVLVTDLKDTSQVITGSYAFDTSTPTQEKSIDTEFTLYPNPTIDEFQIKNDGSIKRVKLYNIIGKELASYNHSRGSAYNVSSLQKGIYIVRLFGNSDKILKVFRLNKK